MFIYWQRVHRCKKCAYIWKVTSDGKAEIENVNYALGDIFNIGSATKVRFSTFTPLFPSLDKPRISDTLCIYNQFWWKCECDTIAFMLNGAIIPAIDTKIYMVPQLTPYLENISKIESTASLPYQHTITRNIDIYTQPIYKWLMDPSLWSLKRPHLGEGWVTELGSICP